MIEILIFIVVGWLGKFYFGNEVICEFSLGKFLGMGGIIVGLFF